ncbi:gliding motility-associated C-terminal domain-containing protein [Crocinitomicaceae bacterium CZZ-1]|uniref:Gliding motility-associated C-terminal domain-containing protein n=1 Tax=Taishania pollutisoli TaxID=2766479 RepID=A0A8J6PFJ2_9FLAO|nr:PKD domain-containing protein [Taishania pollutisoli]MBC9813475.1 gliding motility-associated C-terminal domain-containing protein [Taishania pollutisoli]
MKNRLIFIIITAFLSFSNAVSAQIDTTFWFAAPWVTPSHANNVPVVFRLSSFENPTTVRLYQPAGTFDTTVVVPPNSLNSVFVSHIINTLEAKPANTALDYGIKIEADTLITVVYEVVTNVNNPETYSLKGSNGVGLEFVTPFQTSWNNGSYSPIAPKQMFCIVATEDNTTIWITPRAAIVGHPTGITYSITLDKGQVYTAENVTQATSVSGNNLSGSIIVADKPIAVTISDDSVTNSGGGCRDLMGDQIVPVEVVGTEYIVNKGSMYVASNEGIYVVATENFTEVTITTINGTSTHLLNQGDTWNYVITEELNHVQADKPVYVLQASGFGCELGAALLPPINCAGSSQVSFTRTNNQSFFLNILCPTSAVNNFLLNGSSTLVPGSAFNVVPGTGGQWSGTQISFNTTDLPSGATNLIENTSDFFALGVINGGAGSGCYYHYMSSFIRRIYTDAGTDTTLCNGASSIALNGDIKGATTTGIWSVVNGTGTFQNATNLTTLYYPTNSDYAQGELTFVLTSTGNCNAVTDTMRVDFIQAPIVTVDTDQTFCKNNIPTITISGGVQFATTAIWSGGNGGAFGNPNDLTTTYTPSPLELAADSVALFLTSAGSFFACESDVDTIVLHFTPAPDVFAGPDLFICSDETILSLSGTIGGATTTGEWTTNGNGAFSPSQSNLTTDYLIDPADIASGSFVLVLTSTNNQDCLAEVDTVYVNVTAQPTLDITSQDSICSTSALIPLSGVISGGFGAQWSTNGFGNISDVNALNTYYNVSSVDTTLGYVDFYLTTVGVCSGQMDSIRVYFVNAPVVNAGPDQLLCENSAVQLTGQISGPAPAGMWSSLGTGSFVPGNAFLSTIYFPSAGDILNGGVTLLLESTNNYGCVPENDSLFITFKEVPEATFAVTPVCQGANANFIDQSTFSSGTITNWEWNFGNGTTSSVNNPQHVYSNGGNYTVQLVVTADNNCTDTITQNVVIYHLPVPAFTNTNACEMNAIYFTDQSTLSSGTVTGWHYDFYGMGNSYVQNPEFVFQIPGDYPVTLTVTSSDGCSASITQNVSVIQSPDANFSMTPNPALVGQDVYFQDLSSGTNLTNWYWDFGDGAADNQQNSYHDYSMGGVYTVVLTVTDANNCKDIVSRQISIELLPVLPTGFTPNGDGENDVFIIRGGPFRSVDFKVYSNWGTLIFETNDYTVGWDGTHKGENAPVGVYTWTFVVEMGNGQIVKKSGDVTLIR